MTRATLLPLLIVLTAAPLAATVPAGFTDSLVTALGSPTGLAFTPDGRLLITRQPGVLRIYQGGTLLATPVLTFPSTKICSNSERGLLGVAVDPEFATNHYIYLFYTFNKFNICPVGNPSSALNPVNRVSRFTLPDTNVIDPGTELVIVDNMPSPNGNHNAGDLHFGRDGFLYISIGDGGCDYANNSGCAGSNDAARDQHVLTGKILRITKEGNIPPDNPFQDEDTARCNITGQTAAGDKCRETFAWGLRNPFRTAFDPNAAGTRFFVNDVGQGLWEEIDEGTAAADYGWNLCEGKHNNNSTGPCSNAPPGHVPPVYDYRHGQTIPGTSLTNCNSITGGAFVPNGIWPGLDSSYLFGDFVCGGIFKLTFSGGSWSALDFGQSLGGVTTMIFGPNGNGGRALYYTTFANGGEVRRISYSEAGNAAPAAAASAATDTSGQVPLNVIFDATGSSDPNAGDTLTYFWDFGDGTPEASTTSLTINHTYERPRTYTATLRARDNHFAFSAPETVAVDASAGPLDFFTISPCRLVDTRLSGPELDAGSIRIFPGTGACGIPGEAKALAANVTAVNPTTAGYVQVLPGGTPGAATAFTTAALTFAAGQTRSNNALMLLGPDRDFLVVAGIPTGTVHLVVDVVGWFE